MWYVIVIVLYLGKESVYYYCLFELPFQDTSTMFLFHVIILK